MKTLTISHSVAIRYSRFDQHDPCDYSGFLTHHEIMRSERLQNEQLSRYSILSRGFLRVVLGEYLQMSPTDVPILTSELGKPYLSPNHGRNLHFNISHSGTVWVIAVSETHSIGIDIEYINQDINPFQSAAVAFSLDERSCLQHKGYPVADFFKIWTAKEAVLKATGAGFSYPSNRFSVISSKNSRFVRQFSDEVTSQKRCDIHRFSLFGNYTGAVAEIYP